MCAITPVGLTTDRHRQQRDGNRCRHALHQTDLIVGQMQRGFDDFLERAEQHTHRIGCGNGQGQQANGQNCASGSITTNGIHGAPVGEVGWRS